MTQSPVTVVTGGSRGIGAATALLLASTGHRVAVAYRQDAAAANRIVAAITAAARPPWPCAPT